MQARPARKKKAETPIRRFHITGQLDVHAIEALQLEIRQLALRHGVEITTLRAAPGHRTTRGASA